MERMKESSVRVVAKYLVETPQPLEQAAAVLAGEQSTGTFVTVPGETEALIRAHGARVERLIELDSGREPSLPGSVKYRDQPGEATYHRAEITVSFPLDNIGCSLPNLITTVAGNLYELSSFSGLRLLDMDIPIAFADVYPGPRFGIEGTRRLTGVYGRPVIGTIVKPSVGMSPDETASLVRELVAAGVDFVKDDELIADPPYSPLSDRVDAVMRVINDHADATGKKVMFAFNITGEVDEMVDRARLVTDAGGTCVMVSINSVGVAAVSHLRRHTDVPIHAHRNGWGAMTRAPRLGMSFTAYQKIWRLAGVDQLHVNGLGNKFWEPDSSVVDSAQSCLRPMFGGYQVMPVLSSRQWAGSAPETYASLRTVDLMHLAGGGILGHPGGPAAGVASFHQGWQAAMSDIPLGRFAVDHPELAQAIATFGDT